MKIWLFLGLTLFIFSGCSTKTQNYRLRALNAKQYALIRQQQAQINQLKATLQIRNRMQQQSKRIKKKVTVKNVKVPQAPKKNIKLKKVEDSNYSSTYMYPGAKKKPIATAPKEVVTTIPKQDITNTTTDMTKAECIGMIGEAKFNKYTQMFGSESASLKRCKMLKAMR